MVNDLIDAKILWLATLVVSIFLADKCIKKYYVERIKKFIKREAIPTNYLMYKLRGMDVIFIFLISIMLCSLGHLGLIGANLDAGYYVCLSIIWFVCASVINILMEDRQYNSYLILELLKEKGELSIDEISSYSKRLLKGEGFYFALKPLLQGEMVSPSYQGILTEDKVFYQITPKGRVNYQSYLVLECKKLEEKMFKLRARLRRGIGDPYLELQYEQSLDKLIATRKKITS